MDVPLPPVLRWAGSKKRQLPQLERFFPSQFDTYIEPFAGSACVFFRLRPNLAIIGDSNQHLIEFYTHASKEPDTVYRRFSAIPRDKDTYYKIRTAYNKEKCTTTRSAFFLFLNRNCFNGVFRVNRGGESPGGRPGPIDVSLVETSSSLRVTVEDQGAGIAIEPSKAGFGSEIVRGLIDQLEGEIKVAASTRGTSIVLSVPLTRNSSSSGQADEPYPTPQN